MAYNDPYDPLAPLAGIKNRGMAPIFAPPPHVYPATQPARPAVQPLAPPPATLNIGTGAGDPRLGGVVPDERDKPYAKGGPVNGPGTSTSDSIPARLSDNEYVLTPAMVARLGGVSALEKLRKETAIKPKGFARGGPVRTDVPGGDYLNDQMEQARLAGGARGAGILARGLLTSPLVAGYESLQRVGEESANALRPLASGATNFAGGLIGTQPAQPQPLAPRPAADMSADVGVTSNRVPKPLAPQPQSVDAATMTPTAPVAPTNVQSGPLVRMDAGWQATADLAAAKRAGTGRVKGIGGGLTTPDEYGDAPGYRGPLAPGRGIAGDFDFATQAAADFAARQSKNPEQIQKYIGARNAESRGDAGITNANAISDANARSLLSAAQAGEAQARSALTGVQAADMQATRPGRVAASGAALDQTRAQTAETQAKTASAQALAPGKLEEQSTGNAMAKLDLKARQQVDDVMTKLGAATKPEDIGRLSTQLAGLLGKPKPETYDFKVAESVDSNGAKTPYLISINKATNKTEITPIGPKANPSEAMDAIKQAGGDASKIAAIKARFVANGGDPAMLK